MSKNHTGIHVHLEIKSREEPGLKRTLRTLNQHLSLMPFTRFSSTNTKLEDVSALMAYLMEMPNN
jgi:hypothetical protein